MIIYFADRHMNVLGQASTGLPFGFAVRKDEKIEDVDTGVASFSCYVAFEDKDRLAVEAMTDAGNYLLRKNDDENEFYTVIDSEVDPESHEIYIYAEDAGLDLLNEIAAPYEAAEAHPIAWYVKKWTEDSGFEIGINEIPGLSRKLKWDGESTVTERLASVATQFDNAEVSYSFDIDGLTITNKYVNIHKKRGKDIGDELRINKHLNNIIVKKSVANLATALRVTGGTPEGQEEPITLKGYRYDDGDFYVDSNGVLKSRKAVQRWSRYCWEKKIPGYEGHIEKTYSYDAASQQTLCACAVTKLKSICEMEVNYEADIAILPGTVKIGDRADIVDDNGELYVSARLLQLKTSIAEGTRKATFGEYLIKGSGISDKVEALAAQFAQLAKNRVFYTWIAYADDENGQGITLDSAGKSYMGISANRAKEEPDITDPAAYKWSKIEGASGKGIAGIIEHYIVSNLAEGVTVESGGWCTSPIPAMTADNRYLWNYETLVYSDGSTEDLAPKIIGAYGEPGEAAAKIVGMTEQYYLSTSNAGLVDGDWVRVMPEWEQGKYLWTRWCIEWDEPNPDILTYSEPVIAASLNEIHETAQSAKDSAEAAVESSDAAQTQAARVNAELAQANQEINALAQNLETLSNSMAQNYATKGELTEVNTTLGTQISQNAAQISQTASAVQQVDINAAQALQDAEDAAAAAAAAQQNANEAQNKYDGLKQQADATDEQLEAAKQAVEKAQADAVAAGDAAAAAASAANALSDRVTAAETSITQNAESISLVAESVSSMKIGGRNYVLESRDTRDGETSKIAGFELSEPWEEGQVYTLSFEGEKASGVFAAYRDDGITLVSGGMPFNEMTGRYECTFMCPAQAAADTAGNILTIYNMPSGISTGGNVGFVKLEKGNRATDWTPAPEDGVDYTNDAIASATTKILQTAEDVTIGIMAGYTSSSDFEKYRQEVENLFRANEDGFAFEFSQLEGRITAAQNEIVQRSQFIRLEGGNIIIGNSDSPVQAKFTNDALEFSYNGQTVARFTNEVLEVENISVSNQVRFGSEWAIRPGQYITGKGSNLDDVWIGG